jgi:hypothetical protein
VTALPAGRRGDEVADERTSLGVGEPYRLDPVQQVRPAVATSLRGGIAADGVHVTDPAGPQASARDD